MACSRAWQSYPGILFACIRIHGEVKLAGQSPGGAGPVARQPLHWPSTIGRSLLMRLLCRLLVRRRLVHSVTLKYPRMSCRKPIEIRWETPDAPGLPCSASCNKVGAAAMFTWYVRTSSTGSSHNTMRGIDKAIRAKVKRRRIG